MRILRVVALTVVVIGAVGCGTKADLVTPVTTVPTATVAVSVTGPLTSIVAGNTFQFTAAVTGTTNTAVTWTTDGGTISGSGLFTAPPTAGTFTARATSVADPSKSGTATVVVVVGTGFRVSGPPRVAPLATAQFSALFNDVGVTSAAWTIEGAALGSSISSAGVFTAGPTVGTVTLRATDPAQAGRTATIVVTVATQVMLTINGPSTATLTTADMLTFYPTITPAGVNTDVTWSTTPAGVGTSIPVDWFRGYIAPSTAQTVTVKATSVADPTVSGTIAVTITAATGPAFAATTSAPSSPRFEHAAVTMPDGRVVLIGGSQSRVASSQLATSEVFNPTLGSFSAGPALVTQRWETEAIAIDATRVLVTGGWEEFDLAAITGEIVDLAAGTSKATTNTMSTRRLFHQMVKLTTGPNAGKIAVIGGFNGPVPYGRPNWLSTPLVELFDGTTNSFTAYSASMKSARGLFTATPLADGRFLIAGGYDAGQTTYLSSAELFDPVAGTFTSTGSMTKARSGHTATRLADGTVLIVGGTNDASVAITAEIFNPATGQFTAVGNLAVPRQHHAAALLSDGRVAILGGESGDNFVRGTAEVYDPATKTFSILGRMAIPRRRPTATVLTTGPNLGKVLVFGGGAENKVSGAAEIVP